MQYSLISGDNHIDLTYCPPDLWSSQAPAKWKLIVPRVEQLDDGCHWFVEGQDKGMWNGIGPGFSKYQKGMFAHIDVMKEYGFACDYTPGAQPRPTTPELRLADLDRDGLDAEIIYGCLMINDLIADGEHRAWANKIYNDWAADFAKRSDPNRIFPLAVIPNNDPLVAAAEVRRCAKMGLKGGDLAFKRMSLPLYHHAWYPLWEAAAECHFPISFHSTGFKGLRAPDSPQMEQEYLLEWRLVRSALFQLDGMEVLVSLLASGARVIPRTSRTSFLSRISRSWAKITSSGGQTTHILTACGPSPVSTLRSTWARCQIASVRRSYATTWPSSTTSTD